MRPNFSVKLEFHNEALRAIAKEAYRRKTGTRALRGILEELMLDIMYELPSRQDVTRCTITKEMVEKRSTLNCGAFHDRDINAAVNILNTETVTKPKTKVEIVKETVAENPVHLSLFNVVADGQPQTNKNGHGAARQTRRKKQASSNDVSTHPESILQLSLFD